MIKTVYIMIRATVQINDGENVDHAIRRIAEEADYTFKHEDDICEVIDTELIAATTKLPTRLFTEIDNGI